MKTQVLLSALLLALSATAAHAQSAPGSADPEYTYRVTVNAAGAYRVTVTSFNGPFHYRDVPLLPQNCSGNAGSPVTGAAEMLLFVQPSGPIHAEFHVPMTGGGSGCEIAGEFDLKALDRPPSTSQVDPEMPGQGQKPRMKELPDGINDLRAADPVQIGRNFINWGDVTSLPARQATFRRNGVCYFPYRYITLNAGPGTAEGTSNSLRRNTINGQLLAFDDLPALSPMTATTVNGLIGLPSGWSTIVLEADAPEYLAESSEFNNVRSVVVNVQGSCY
ncbi:hypothetical protein [Tahibacter sp.]|uniref:hypothetical protein n=1 Tax=Tahibacter sp. TaxID=2056211 RepID=UPI0028C48233|nr:hypothetical protein [Tahibacter sp.]